MLERIARPVAVVLGLVAIGVGYMVWVPFNPIAGLAAIAPCFGDYLMVMRGRRALS